MRDINRIDPFCEKLAEYWKAQPDMRFGQLMSNVLGEVYAQTKKDIFFIEDAEMLAAIDSISWLHKKEN